MDEAGPLREVTNPTVMSAASATVAANVTAADATKVRASFLTVFSLGNELYFALYYFNLKVIFCRESTRRAGSPDGAQRNPGLRAPLVVRLHFAAAVIPDYAAL